MKESKVVFQDGGWFVGRRVNYWERLVIPETHGTHHWIVTNNGTEIHLQRGDRVAVPIDSMRFLVLADSFYADGSSRSKALPF